MRMKMEVDRPYTTYTTRTPVEQKIKARNGVGLTTHYVNHKLQ